MAIKLQLFHIAQISLEIYQIRLLLISDGKHSYETKLSAV
jgi:hypothetical protein